MLLLIAKPFILDPTSAKSFKISTNLLVCLLEREDTLWQTAQPPIVLLAVLAHQAFPWYFAAD
jgi:hypothetical protein